jgi:hypothetical protein
MPARGGAARSKVAAAGASPACSLTVVIHCSTADAPTRDLLNSQHLTNNELCALVDYCYRTGTREGLQVAAMVLLGIYGGLRWAWQLWHLHLPHTAVQLHNVAVGGQGTGCL